MNFLLMEMTHLRYWMPMVVEGNRRKIQSTFYIGPSHKYNCPMRHESVLRKLAQKHNINILPLNKLKDAKGLLFSSEKTGIAHVKQAENVTKIAATYQTDFIESYHLYVDQVDHVLMPSKFCAEYYGLTTEKNLFLGIPKYDVPLNKEEVLNKYSIPADKKKALIVWPKRRDEGQVDIKTIFNALKKQGFTLMVKTRGKDPLTQDAIQTLRKKNDFYFEDDSWHPHTTQELLEVSDVVVNFGSTTIEECVMQDVPLINFDVKPEFRNGNKKKFRVTHDYLYDYDYCVEMPKDCKESQVAAAVTYLTNTDLSAECKKARQNHLFDHKDSCKRILDVLLYQV